MAEQAGAFGSYLDKDIIKQIEVRQKIQGRKSPREGELFSEKDYQVLYHNDPWVCLRSSVDAPRVGKWKPGQKTPVTSDAARNYILCGGTLEYTGMDGKTPKLKFTGEPNISNGRETPGYRKDEVMGYRPKPGISKVVVKTKDTFGCIMEAVIDFTVYSRDDLELIDQIYFKPGMSALLEWGHSSYHDSKGARHHMTTSDLFPFEEFFGTAPFETIEKEVQNWRKSRNLKTDTINEGGFCGNYEVLFGYVTNFSYSFNTNGSYTCTVKLLSKGSILEGLQIPANLESKPVKVEEKEKDRQESSIKTTFHEIFNVAKKAVDLLGEDYRFHPVPVECTWDGEKDIYEFQGKKIIHRKFLTDGKVPVVYLKLNTFLHIVNRIVKAARVDYVPFEVEPLQSEELEEDRVHSGMSYVSFNEHFSLNPGVVVLPTRAAVSGSDYKTIPATMGPEKNELTLNQVLSMTITGLPAGPLSAQYNIIGDLWVNVDFILSVLDGILNEETQQYSLKSLIEGILGGIQKALGNINSFGIQINEVTGKAVIVDRNSIASGVQDPVDQDPPIIVSGVQTTVTNLRVTSEVSAEMASEMSVAATAPEDGRSIANIDQVFWNEGCEDRHRAKESDEYVASNPADQFSIATASRPYQYDPLNAEQAKKYRADLFKVFFKSHEFLEQVYALYLNFVSRKASKEAVSTERIFSQYVESSFENLQRDGEYLFRRCVNRDVTGVAGQEGINEASYFQAGVIPIKIGFTMKGLGRFLIGSTFKISEGLVPRKYKDWRNIITGIEHNIDKGGWTTTVTALYYPALVKVRKPETTSGFLKSKNNYQSDTVETVLPAGKPLEQPRDTVEKFFRYFWENTETQPSVCAKYVAMMAKSWSTGILHTSGDWGSAGYVTRDGTSLFAQKAAEIGWTQDAELTKKDVSSKEVKDIISRVTSPGDIVVYYWKNPYARTKDGYTYYCSQEGSLQHVQMKMPNRELKLGKGGTTKTKKYSSGAIVKADSTWTTSNFRNYGREFVYENQHPFPDKWDIWVLHAPKINERWSSIKV